jgi:hypothetical protein
VTAAVLLAVGALAIAAGINLSVIPVTGRGLPMWDPAEHGLAGVELAEALRRGDVLGFVLGINRQVMWPFMHSLLLAPWVLAFGNDYAVTARLSSVLFAATVVGLFLTGLRLHPTRGAWVGAAAAALALTAPLPRFFGTVAMLEMPGACLLAITACLHLRACREPAPRGILVAAGASTTALFLCKYNYGLMWVIPLVLHEWLALPASDRSAAIARVRAYVGSWVWLRPFPVFMLLFLLVIAAIHLTGGGVLQSFGARISMRSPGNALYAFFVISLGWGLARVPSAGGFTAVWRRLSERHRILAATVALPLVIWFLIPIPNRVRTLVGFVVNRDSGQPLWSLETLLYYPRVFVTDYSPDPIVGWIVLALAMLAPIRRAQGRDPVRLLQIALWVGLIATALHPYRQPRFLFTVAPLIWLLGATRAVALVNSALASVRAPTWVLEPAWGIALVATLWAAVFGAPSFDATLAAHRAFNAPEAIGGVLDRVFDQARRAESRPWLLGTWNGMSPALVRWHALLTAADLPRERLPEPATWLASGSPESTLVGRIEELRRAGRPVIAAVSDLPFAGATEEYRQETWADRETFARLSTDPRVRKEAEVTLPESGFRIATFRFLDSTWAVPQPR